MASVPAGRAPSVALQHPQYTILVDMERGVLLIESEARPWRLEVDISRTLFGRRREYMPISGIVGAPAKADGYVDVKRGTLVIGGMVASDDMLKIDVTSLLI